MSLMLLIFFFKQKSAYEMRISDWSSDVCSSDLTKVSEHVEDALGKGAEIAARAEAPEGFTTPLVLTGVDTTMRLAQEETFGPVAPIFRFDDEADAVAIANATPFGLAAYYFTSDIDRAWRVGEALEFGMVGLNTGAISTPRSEERRVGKKGASTG